MEELKSILKSYEVLQDTRLRAENQLRTLKGTLAERTLEKLKDLKSLEKALSKQMKEILDSYEEWNRFLKHVKGIGPTLATKLITLELDPTRPPSSWNAFFGLVPAYWVLTCEKGHHYSHTKMNKECPICKSQPVKFEKKESIPRKTRGVLMFFDTDVKKLYYLVGTQFVKSGKFYKDFYYQVKQRKIRQYPEYPDGRIHYQALRSTFKLFLNHYYEVKREISGLPPMKAYQFEYLSGHDYISYKDVVRYETAEDEE